MGAARNDENPDKRHGYGPKLILAGRLTGTLDGRPVVIEADESGLLVSMSSLKTVWAARRTVSSLLPLMQTLKHLKIPLSLRIAGIFSVVLLPTTSAVAKLISPPLSRLG